MLGEAGIPYAYAMELRDTGDYGFMLPAREIVPTGEEVGQEILKSEIDKSQEMTTYFRCGPSTRLWQRKS